MDTYRKDSKNSKSLPNTPNTPINICYRPHLSPDYPRYDSREIDCKKKFILRNFCCET